MTAGPVLLMLACAFTLAGAIGTYERLLTRLRVENERLLDDQVDLIVRHAKERHPVNYGGGNLRLISGGE